tara:strand:+ start:2430 stop:2873 length:444 start_codon:yes stop_codon:yes gene_type:complete
MTQGDFIKVSSKEEIAKRMPLWVKRLEEWDYTTACCIKLEPYGNPKSMSQIALFHIWCREIEEQMKVKAPQATDYAWELWFRKRFIGEDSYKLGSTSVTSVKPLPKGKGAMCKFMDQVFDYCNHKIDVKLSMPKASEFLERRKELKT